jgi:hypothetical protein
MLGVPPPPPVGVSQRQGVAPMGLMSGGSTGPDRFE